MSREEHRGEGGAAGWEHRLRAAIDELMPEAAAIFDTLAQQTADTVGITRPSYGAGETVAWTILADAARRHGLSVGSDIGANLVLRRPGAGTGAGGVYAGSHLDSVPKGGNFDGAAGVVAGWLALAAFERAGIRTAYDLTVLGMRGEESAWFGVHHIGSRAALGLIPAHELETARRIDTQRTLGEHMAEEGADTDAVRRGIKAVDPATARAYVELHIEQGPVLVHEDIAVGIVAGIRGNMRARNGRCIGEYSHSGAVPRGMRRDAVMAMAEFVAEAEAEWERLEKEGRDLVLTFGKLHTDPAHHSHNKVPGEVRFVVDARSHEVETLDAIQAFLESKAATIAARRGVTLDLGKISRVAPAPMSGGIRALMREGAQRLNIAALDMASGGGHDAGDFANAGVPSGMVFVRNPNGSHNPDEAMAMEDFRLAAILFARTLASLAGVED